MIGISFSHGQSLDDFFLNLGTEIFGIVLTIAFVDIILEKRKQEDAARKIAWNVLHDLDHAVWVWQGGAREFDLDEMAGLLMLVENNDPLPQFTQNLFLRIGSRADSTLRTQNEALSANNNLKNGLEILKSLARMRDVSKVLSPFEIRDTTNDALSELVKAVNLIYTAQDSEILSKYRETSTNAQEWRHFGNDKGHA